MNIVQTSTSVITHIAASLGHRSRLERRHCGEGNSNIPVAVTANDETIQVYPNPATGLVNIKLPNREKGCWKVMITNATGTKVLEKQITQGESLTSFIINGSKGIYFVNVYNCSTGKQQVSKIILQ